MSLRYPLILAAGLLIASAPKDDEALTQTQKVSLRGAWQVVEIRCDNSPLVAGEMMLEFTDHWMNWRIVPKKGKRTELAFLFRQTRSPDKIMLGDKLAKCTIVDDNAVLRWDGYVFTLRAAPPGSFRDFGAK